MFAELLILYIEIGWGIGCIFMWFFSINFWLIKEEEAPESIIASKEMVCSSPCNIIGIFRCCPFTPDTIEDRETEATEENKENLFEMYGSA